MPPPATGRRPGASRPLAGRRPRRAVGVLASAAAAGSLILVAAGGRGSEAPAAGAQALPVVFDGHPRLIVGGFRGPTVDDLAAACAAPEMRLECDGIGGGLMADAMNYLLHGDLAAAGRAKSWLLGGVSCGDGVERTAAGGHALAYDWIAPSITRPAEKARIEAGLAACGTRIAEALRGNGPHLWHGYTSQAAALALVALALDLAPERETLLADAVELFRGNALAAWQVTGGAWPEGYSYERSHFFSSDPPAQYVLDALRAWDSAVAQDTPDHASIFETIAQDQGDWLRGLAYHLVYGSVDRYGDDGKVTLLRGGDTPTGQIFPNKQFRPFTDAIARIYDDPVLAGWGASLERDWSFVGGTGTYHPIHRYALPLNLPVGVGTSAPDGLPLARIWGRADVGYILARSSWSPGETLVGYRAGKWFTGHQHMDQGHLDIWRRGPLAVDSGVYAPWGTRHREAYYLRTVAHNTLLVPQAGETFDEHPQSPVHVNDGGQRVLTYRGCPQCMQSVAEWRGNVGDGLHFEAGAIEAFLDQPAFMAVASDLTSAYNSTRFAAPENVAKVASVERDLVFLRPGLLLVADRVQVTGTASAPRFVLHFPRRPDTPEVQVVEGTLEDGILTSPGPTFTMDNGTGGRLIGRTMVPATVTMTLIGGSRYRYWVDGANQLDGSRSEEKPPAEPGTWRIEVQSAAVGRDYLMLHALTITDEGAGEVATALLPVTGDPAAGPAPMAIAAPAMGAVVLMSTGVPRSPVTYAEFQASAAGLLVATNLLPDTPYRAAFGPARPTTLKSSSGPEATWPIEVPGPGRVFLGRCPAPSGAGANWVDLCTDPTPTPTPTPTATATPEGLEGHRLLLPALGNGAATPRPRVGHTFPRARRRGSG